MSDSNRRFEDKTVLITGASAGIGAAAARRFGAEGARLVLAARGRPALESLADELTAAGRDVEVIPTDVGDIDAATRLVEQTVERTGGLDVLVNNAGVNYRGELTQHTPAQLAQIVAVNLSAPIVLCRLALPHLTARQGAIVNVASLAGRIPVVHEATYSATKFGLRAFTIALAEEVKEAGVRASVVSPGPVDTGFIMEDIDTVPDLVFSQPMSSAEEIAELVIECAADGRVERMRPKLGGYLATLGYVFPGLRRALVPMLERKGRAAKQRFIERNK
ncbi:MAG: SDR family oxidoreductase [Deltaproteobacteria bacterium]|nr:SDR family oxidoreductase [Deltaproteobacteria bacterium]